MPTALAPSWCVASVVMIPLSECLGECVGQRNDVIVCLIGFTASSVLCELAPNLAALLGSPQAMPSRSNP